MREGDACIKVANTVVKQVFDKAVSQQGQPWTSLGSSGVSSHRDDPDSPYCLPTDSHEKIWLDKQHQFIRNYICGGRLVLDDTLTLKEGAVVLDIGAGSGT